MPNQPQWCQARKPIVNLWRRPVANPTKLTPPAQQRLRQTQLTPTDFASQIIRTEKNCTLLHLADGTYGWALTQELRKTKKPHLPFQPKPAKINFPAISQTLSTFQQTPYLWGGTTEHGLDCSAFSQKFCWQVGGLLLPRNSRAQAKCGQALRPNQIRPLDLIFFSHQRTQQSHVGVYWGNRVWHFCQDRKGLAAEPLPSLKKRYHYLTARRLFPLPSPIDPLTKLLRANSIHVVGISGTEGAEIAQFLKQQKIPFQAHDFSPNLFRNFKLNHFGLSPAKQKALWENLQQNKIEPHYLAGIPKADLVFVSQNFAAYPQNRSLQKLYQKSPAKFATLTQLYFKLFPGRILAVTGTNGKSTTTKLCAEILSHTPHKVWFTGNDRRNEQVLTQFDKWTKKDFLVIEVSNRQLNFPLPRSPDFGVLTNITPNHLDEYHNSFATYRKIKFRLIAKQTPPQFAILNATITHPPHLQGQVCPFPNQQRGVALSPTNWFTWRAGKRLTKICPLATLRNPNLANISNTFAAFTATRLAGASFRALRTGLKNFTGLPQRLECVYEKNGVRFLNDSASTTPESTIAALQTFKPGSILLIAGGDSKQMNFAQLAKQIQQSQVRPLLLKSPAQRLITRELTKLKVPAQTVLTLTEALKLAHKAAKKGDCVLLSPAAAYFCYFQKRLPLGGRGFKQLAKILN